jgi:8-oxo-dGTP diphosphatase
VKYIDVTAAILFSGKKLLIAQRNKQSFMGGKWEFPGGKIEKGETGKECLAREISEEFGAEIEVGKLLTKVEYEYNGVMNVRLHPYFCKVKKGTLKVLEHENIAWVLPMQLKKYDLVPADKEIAMILLRRAKDLQISP